MILTLLQPCPWPSLPAYTVLQTVWYLGGIGDRNKVNYAWQGVIDTCPCTPSSYTAPSLQLPGGPNQNLFIVLAHCVARVQGTAQAFNYGTPLAFEWGLAISMGYQGVMRLQRSIDEAAYWPGGASTLGPRTGLPHGHLQVSAKGDYVSFTTALLGLQGSSYRA